MTFEEAKARNDYNFHMHQDGYPALTEIAEVMKHRTEGPDWIDAEWGYAVLEIGCVDVEVNLFYGGEGKVIDADFFCCIKTEPEYWDSDDYIDGIRKMNWDAEDLTAELERCMFNALDAYVQRMGYSYDNLNSLR